MSLTFVLNLSMLGRIAYVHTYMYNGKFHVVVISNDCRHSFVDFVWDSTSVMPIIEPPNSNV